MKRLFLRCREIGVAGDTTEKDLVGKRDGSNVLIVFICIFNFRCKTNLNKKPGQHKLPNSLTEPKTSYKLWIPSQLDSTDEMWFMSIRKRAENMTLPEVSIKKQSFFLKVYPDQKCIRSNLSSAEEF
ncbi:hypothetical protein LOAG_07338 [Loa loa]|uniref:Uncharacterized protein n=1 Tax=Loa loa TaxID=7209 RepID=A0A1S0TW07_LOALO|nr:hypothetical protein LOAG_07338 [Loa loa]EFO21149.1 hypothetical protein LOAG_07338 [Loa loa]